MLAELAADQVGERVVRPHAEEDAEHQHAAPRMRQRLADYHQAGKQHAAIRRAEEADAHIGDTCAHPEHVPHDKRQQQHKADHKRARQPEEVHAERIERRRHDAEHLVGQLRIGAQHVVELPRAYRSSGGQQGQRGPFACKDAQHGHRDVYEPSAETNLQVRSVLELLRRFPVRKILQALAARALFCAPLLAALRILGHLFHRPESPISGLELQQTAQ